jgi:hypothetical protein
MHTAVVTFTARPLEWILSDQGSRDWRLNADRARHCEFLVCTQNRHNAEFGAPTAPHGAAFLIGRISDVVESPERNNRWLIKISEYVECNLPNIWGKSRHLRYPVWYTTLEGLGIDPSTLGPFRPLPRPDASAPLAAPAGRSKGPEDILHARSPRGDRNEWERLNAILAQIDRIPNLPEPLDPLDWDERGLPR